MRVAEVWADDRGNATRIPGEGGRVAKRRFAIGGRSMEDGCPDG